MIIPCKIQVILAIPYDGQKLTSDIDTWYDIEKLYIITEDVDVPYECVCDIVKEQAFQVAPTVCFRSDSYHANWSKLNEVNHRVEVEHRAKFQQRLVDSGRFTDENVKDLTDRFFVMVYPACNLSKPKEQKEPDTDVLGLDVAADNPNSFIENGILFERLDDGTKRLICCLDKDIRKIDDSEVSIIEEKAFKDCYFLQEINFPNAKTVKRKAFQNCTGLINVDFGENCVFPTSIAGTFDCPLIWYMKPQFEL